jgi:hypothetical protein
MEQQRSECSGEREQWGRTAVIGTRSVKIVSDDDSDETDDESESDETRREAAGCVQG